jgi:excisionase family DNA binding protein
MPVTRPDGTDEWLTIPEAAALLGYQAPWLRRLIGRGELASEKRLDPQCGSRRYIARGELERFIRRRAELAALRATGEPINGRPARVPKLPEGGSA